MFPLSPVNVRMQVPVPMSHSFTVPSYEPVSTFVPSGLNATELTQLVCPANVWISVPVAAFHSVAVQPEDRKCTQS